MVLTFLCYFKFIIPHGLCLIVPHGLELMVKWFPVQKLFASICFGCPAVVQFLSRTACKEPKVAQWSQQSNRQVICSKYTTSCQQYYSFLFMFSCFEIIIANHCTDFLESKMAKHVHTMQRKDLKLLLYILAFSNFSVFVISRNRRC